jgi:hypothetical protein
VSRVFASNFEEGNAYVVKTGFQRDDFEPLVFKTTDYGETWTSIAGNLPQEVIYVIFEDKKNPGLLFVGTDIGVFVTIDGGKKWVSMKNNMPTNPIHDLLIHPRENELVVGSYGFGIYVTDISPLQELDEKVLSEDVHLFEVEPKVQWRYRSAGGPWGHRHFNAPNEKNGLVVYYYLKNDVKENVRIIITDPYGKELSSLTGSKKAGISSVVWNMQRRLTKEERERGGFRMRSRALVSPGEYVVTLQIGGKKLTREALIRPMPDTE